MQKNQDTALGKVKSLFSKSAQSLDNHNYLFDLLPSGDKYTSVFTGAFSAVVKVMFFSSQQGLRLMWDIKATVTHDKIASEISSGFDEIADQVRSFYFVIKLHPRSTYIKYYIAMFYFELFGFLVCIMREWYQSSWRRLSKSLGSSFLESTVQGTLSTLSLYTKRVEAEDARRMREMNTRQLYTLGAMMQASLANQAKMEKDMRRDYAMLSAYVTKDLPAKIAKDMLQDGSTQSNQTTGYLPLPDLLTGSVEGREFPGLGRSGLPGDAPGWSRDSIMRDVNPLKPYVQSAAHVERLIDLSHSITVNSEISIRVHQWVMNTSSQALWIEGPSGPAEPSQSTLTSAFMLGNLRRVGIPAMVEFCQYDPRYWRTWNAEKELLNIIYALVYQAAKIIPERLQPEIVPLDFSSSRFQALSGNVETLPEAIKLLADLIAVGPPLQFVLVDGLQLFDGRQSSSLVQNSMKDLIAVLCKAVADASGEERVLKVLFTTNGLVGELADAAKASLLSRERYDSENEDELLTIKDVDLIR